MHVISEVVNILGRKNVAGQMDSVNKISEDPSFESELIAMD